MEHKNHSPECPLFHLDSEDARLETFINWPHKEKGFLATEIRVMAPFFDCLPPVIETQFLFWVFEVVEGWLPLHTDQRLA